MTSGADEGVSILDPQACWQLLDQEEVGRLAVVGGHVPAVFPINYVVDEKMIIFRTHVGTKLLAIAVRSAVAFEVDDYNPQTGEAWSVVIKGHAEEIPMHDTLDDSFPLFPWTASPKPRFVRVVPDEVTGRRFHVVERRPHK